MTLEAKKQNKKIVFSTSDDEEPNVEVKSRKPTFKSTVRENGNNKFSKPKNNKVVFEENLEDEDTSMKTVKLPRPNNKKIVFNENLEDDQEDKKSSKKITFRSKSDDEEDGEVADSQFVPLEKKGEENQKWYQVVSIL